MRASRKKKIHRGHVKRTEAVFELPLHSRVVHISLDFQVLQMLAQREHTLLLVCLSAPVRVGRLSLDILEPLVGFLNELELLCPILGQQLTRLLETVVWQLLKGDVGRLADGSSPPPGPYGVYALLEQLLFRPSQGRGIGIHPSRLQLAPFGPFGSLSR